MFYTFYIWTRITTSLLWKTVLLMLTLTLCPLEGFKYVYIRVIWMFKSVSLHWLGAFKSEMIKWHDVTPDIAFCSWLKLRIYIHIYVIYHRIQHYTGQQWGYWGRGALYLWFYLIYIRVWRISRIISRVLILNGSKLCCSISNYYEKGFQLNKHFKVLVSCSAWLLGKFIEGRSWGVWDYGLTMF